jgi:hypothetical protein
MIILSLLHKDLTTDSKYSARSAHSYSLIKICLHVNVTKKKKEEGPPQLKIVPDSLEPWDGTKEGRDLEGFGISIDGFTVLGVPCLSFVTFLLWIVQDSQALKLARNVEEKALGEPSE